MMDLTEFCINQEETMKIDTGMAETAETCAMNSSSEEVYFRKQLSTRAVHTAILYQMNMEIQNE